MLQTIIDTQIKKRRDAETAERDNSKFRISDAGRCHLYRFWKRSGKPMNSQTDANGYRVQELGIMIHELVQSLLVEAEIQGNEITSIFTEQQVEDEHRLGHFDISFIWNHEDRILYDVKTISSKQAYFYTKNGVPDNRQHALQICSYAAFVNPDELHIVYINRDNLEIIADKQIFKCDYWGEMANDWNTLITAWKEGREPEANPEHWECKYCPYVKSCGAALLIV